MIDIDNWANLSQLEKDSIVESLIIGYSGSYTTDLNAAYSVAAEMVRLGCFVSVFQGPGTSPTCSIWGADKPSHISKQIGNMFGCYSILPKA